MLQIKPLPDRGFSMEDEISFKNTNELEISKWLQEHTIINNEFLREAQEYDIKPFTNMFWLYSKHRDYEEFGKHNFCFTGITKIAEDIGLTERQTLKAYQLLQEKGIIKHVWCDQKIYRNKTRLFVSAPLIKKMNMQINESNLITGNKKLKPEDKDFIKLRKEEYPKRKEEYPKRKEEYPERYLNNYNKQLDINILSKDNSRYFNKHSVELSTKEKTNNKDSNVSTNKVTTKSSMVEKKNSAKRKEPNNVNSIYQFFLLVFDKTESQIKLTPERRRKLKCRLSSGDIGLEKLQRAIFNAGTIPFYSGVNDRGWKANLDFIIRSYEKAEELADKPNAQEYMFDQYVEKIQWQ